jgi:hypothetical protein
LDRDSASGGHSSRAVWNSYASPDRLRDDLLWSMKTRAHPYQARSAIRPEDIEVARLDERPLIRTAIDKSFTHVSLERSVHGPIESWQDMFLGRKQESQLTFRAEIEAMTVCGPYLPDRIL